jgi:integrase
MPLTLVRRKSTGALTISGIVAGRRVQRRAQSDDPKLAREEAAALEAEILRAAWHGERRDNFTLSDALRSYLEARPRSRDTQARLRRIRDALGDQTKLRKIDQDTISRLRREVLRPGAGEAALLRGVVIPLRAVLHHAARRGWCSAPMFETARVTGGRTLFMTPAEAEQLVAAAAAHIKPLLLFLLGCGARLSEAIYLDWRDVDLAGGRAIFWPDRTKSGRRRVASLSLRSIAALTALPTRSGPVFLTATGRPYQPKDGEGGQIKRAWDGAIRRAGLPADFTPHTCRHTWASWHYAVHRDLLKLKVEGGWSSIEMVERYAHLMPAGHTEAICSFWRGDQAVTGARRRSTRLADKEISAALAAFGRQGPEVQILSLRPA